MKNQLAPLLKNIYTKQDLLRRITAGIKVNRSRPLESKTFPDRKVPITPDIEGIKGAEQWVEKLPVATITLAVTLPKEEINRLGQWFRGNAHPQVLLDIRQNPNIIGGCQIIWQGFEGDFSLRKKFQSSFAKATEGKENG